MKAENALIESEQTVIGSLLINNECIDRIEGLKAQAFYREDHRIIFKSILSFLDQNKPVDMILLAEELSRKGDLERVGNLAYIGAMVQGVMTTKNVKSHALKVINQWKLRRLKALLADLGEDVESRLPVEEILGKAEAEMFGLLEGSEESSLVTIKQAVIAAVDWEDEDRKCVQTGLRDLDRLTGGFGKSNMIVIAGRPSMGKSALAVQIAEHASHSGHVIIFSLEMSYREIGSRFLYHHKDRVGISQAIAHSGDLNMQIDDRPAITIQYIRSACRKAKRKTGLDMIVIDYLQLMQGAGDNRTQEIGAISRGLKGIAKEFDIPVIVLSQLSRKVEDRADKRPLMSDLRDSGEIEQDADLILLIYREEAYDKETENKGIAEIICRKNRNGATGEVLAKFTGETTRFEDFNGQRILRSVKQSRGFVD
jgi:replicative DNA helicase